MIVRTSVIGAVLAGATFTLTASWGVTVTWTNVHPEGVKAAVDYDGIPLPGVRCEPEPPDPSQGALIQFVKVVGGVDDPRGDGRFYGNPDFTIDDVILDEAYVGCGMCPSDAPTDGTFFCTGDVEIAAGDTIYVRAFNLPKSEWLGAALEAKQLGIRNTMGEIVSHIVAQADEPQTYYFDDLQTWPVSFRPWYVNGSVSQSGNGLSPATPFKTIQEGIDAASHNDTVIVVEGLYYENIRFHGKDIVLRSREPSSPGVVARTIIDGGQADTAVTFSGTEGPACVLSGFTIRNGRPPHEDGGGIRGGSPENRTRATICNNVITGNASGWDQGGGGIAYCDGTIEGNTISGNTAASRGGGLFQCDGIIQNNVISDNVANGHGGGLAYCDGIIRSNTITQNSGPALHVCLGTITSCIVWGNDGVQIVWEDFAVEPPNEPPDVPPTYCCIQGWPFGGTGNITASPHFVDPDSGDFHLSSWSPCIDAGDPRSPFSEEPEPNGGRMNMGAYGNTAEAATRSPDADSDGLPDAWEVYWFGDLTVSGGGDPDGDGIDNATEYSYGWDPTVAAQRTLVENLTKGTEYENIQPALDDSRNGDEIVVHPGVYVENINFAGKNVILRSLRPSDSQVVGRTVIDGAQLGPTVRFAGTEDGTCVLSGFTIRNGKGGIGGGICGGTSDNHTSATIEKNVILKNFAVETEQYVGVGGGIYGCAGLVQHNVIRDNTAQWHGGGLAFCEGVIQSNIVSGNAADHFGGGLDYCGGIIQNNVISGNAASRGGGLALCHGAIRSNLIVANSGTWGGGLLQCNGAIVNNTICGNSSFWGGGMYECMGTIRNCIVWGNASGTRPQVEGSSPPTYSCLQGWDGGGAGNITEYPQFLDPEAGEYRLRTTSPCINAGANEKWMWDAVDLAGNARVFNGTVDMGAYEYRYSGPWHVDCSVPVSGDGRSWETAFKIIQEGLDAAGEGEEVIVAEGVYAENVRFTGKNIILHSTDPSDPKVVASTIIMDGGGNDAVVTFVGSETPECLLLGFTIRNGYADYGAGVCGGTRDRHTRATIRNSTVTGNRAAYDGGGIAFCDGSIENNVIRENEAEGNGGGLFDCQGSIRDNTISGNGAVLSGGGVYWCLGTIEDNVIDGNSAARGGGLDSCGGTIQNNVIAGNSASYGGGGLAWCEGTIQRNIIRENSAFYGGGLAWGEGIIQNNLIVGNWVDDRGGGFEGCNGIIRNNTIVANAAPDRGGGLADCEATILNCIIWGNMAGHFAQLSDSKGPMYCCTQEWGEGEGNFSANPRFVDADGPDDDPGTYEDNDYHPGTGSPCVDAGKNEAWMWNALDMDSNLRIFHGGISLTVDVGAYEYSSSPFRVVGVVEEVEEGIRLTWNSSPGLRYVVWSCNDLVNGEWLEEASLLAQETSTAWTDPQPGVLWKFYRIELR